MNHNTLALILEKQTYFLITLVVFLLQNPEMKNCPTEIKEII